MPRVVQGFKSSDGGLSWTFTLRSNAKFHDGSPVTAEEVSSFIRRNSSSSYAGFRNIADVRTTAANEVTVKLRSASSMFLEDLYEPLKKMVGDRAIGTGPFQLLSQTPDEAVLIANSDYYAGGPQLKRLVIKAYPAFRLTYASLLRNEIDGVYELGQDAVEFLKDQSTVRLYPYTRPYALVIAFNNGLPKFHDPRVKQALNMAVNRREVIQNALRGQGEDAGTSVSARHWAFDPRYAGFSYDPQRAVRLLNAAGLTTTPRLRFTCLLPQGWDAWERTALLIQRQLAEIDVDVRFDSLPFAEAMKRIARGDFDALLTDMAGGPGMNVQYRLWHSPSQSPSWNSWNYRNPDTDNALDALTRAVGEPAYRRAVSVFQQAIADDPPAMFLAWRVASRAISRRFEVFAQPGHDIRETLWSWRTYSNDQPRQTH